MRVDLFAAPPVPRLPFVGRDQEFPIHRIYCVGRNFADHAKEMGAPVERGTPVIFMKPADAVHRHPRVPYPSGTSDLHHEVEMVVAIGRDADGPLSPGSGLALVCGYGVGLDLTRRDLQAIAKDKRLPWDVSKGFDASAPASALRHVDDIGHPS
ncbi:MAG: fumarylacetoacetate hydrolase family protein, partial [Silanimonas sp.]